MDDLIDDTFGDPNSGRNEPEFTVSEISGAVKRTLEGTFGRVRVRGEVGRVFRARSGHLYFDVKDDRSVLAAVAWKGQVASLDVVPEEGLEVVATGRLTTFGSQSKYQLNVDAVQLAGQGALMAMLEKRRAQLAAEGLFDAARKRPLPFLPDVIGVVTSPQGAVIRDILHRLRERFPRRVLIWPVAVQGKQCAPEVAAAIRGFNAMTPTDAVPRPDLLIVARGGGSVEDLWGFNEEAVVRAAADSFIPLISAVGHETDTTLIDHAADKRAPTPTAAAEIAVPVRADLAANVDGLGVRMDGAARTTLRARRQRLVDVARGVPRPAALLDAPRGRLDRAGGDLPRALRNRTQRAGLALSRLGGRVDPGAVDARLARARARLDGASARLDAALRRRVERRRAVNDAQAAAFARLAARGFPRRRDALAGLSARLTPATLRRTTARGADRLAATAARMAALAGSRTDRLKDRLAALDRLRRSLGPDETLRRGYAVVRSGGHVLTSADAARAADAMEIQFHDGRVPVGIAAPSPAPRRKQPTRDPKDQGSLF